MSAVNKEVRFDDIDTLRTYITEDYGPFGRKVLVTQDMIDNFAELTGDPQWIHSDVERCERESPWGTTIAHGFLVLSLLAAMRTDPGVDIIGANAVINYGADKLRFVNVVPSDREIHAHKRLVDVTARKTGTLVTQETEVQLVGENKPVMVYRQLGLFVG